MNKNLLILLLLLLLLIAGYFLFLNPSNSGELESDLERETKELRRKSDSLIIEMDKAERQFNIIEAELLKSKAVVKRSEIKLSELLKRERHAQIENKRLIEKYSDYQLDSAFMAMYPVPDSIR